MLSTPGIGSGLDIGSIINQLMAIERRPLVELGTDQVGLEAQLSGFGKLKSTVSQFKSAMGELADTDTYKAFKATSSDSDVISASADATAAKGNYAIEVLRVAENHRQAAATVFADTGTTTIGLPGETMTITVGSTAFDVEIGDKTLEQVRDSINSASNNSGVTASILQDDNGFHLTLSADATGSANFVTLAYSGADPFSMQNLNLDRDGSLVFDAADLDAVITLENTFTVTRSSNTIGDAIAGVTLNLESAGTVNLTVARDNDKIRGSVQQFISTYNEVISVLGELRRSVLADERSSLLSIEAQFRGVLNTKSSGSDQFTFLFELGVSTGLDGKLSLNATTFNSALNSDPEGIAAIFANSTDGLATRFEALAESFISAGGLFDNREQSLNSQIRRVENARTSLEFRLVQKEQALVQQYSALDALLANLTATSSFLTTQLDQIAAINSQANGGR